jgi:DNA-binding MarR family transcriptional regulator
LTILSGLPSAGFGTVLILRKAAELELTFSLAQVLCYAEQHRDYIMDEVVKAYHITLPAITQIIDRLEQKGFMARRNDPADRRVYTLDPRTEGKALVRELNTLQSEGLERVLARMSSPDRRHVLKGLEALGRAARGEGKELKGRAHRCRKSRGATAARLPLRTSAKPASQSRH